MKQRTNARNVILIKTIELHIRKHKVEYFECSLCDVTFEDLDNRITHSPLFL